MIEQGDYGPVVILKGRFKDRTGWYDDDEGGRVIVYPDGNGEQYLILSPRAIRPASKEEIMGRRDLPKSCLEIVELSQPRPIYPASDSPLLLLTWLPLPLDP